MGEFDSRDEVVSYLKNIGVPETLITAQTVGSGNGGGGKHWRIESNGSQGVVINNNVDGKSSSAFECSAFRITQREVTFEIKKVYKEDNTIAINGTSPIDGTKAIYGVYTEKECTNKVAEITIGEDGTGSIELSNRQYYVKEISAPTGYDLSTEVFALNVNQMAFVTEEVTEGIIKINKTAEDGVIDGRKFKVVGSDGKTYTQATDANGVALFTELPVYDMSMGKEITYTISEINVDTRYETPKAQNVTLTSGTVDLTVTANFVNELKTGSIRINKQSEDNQNGDRTFTITGNGETYTITTGADGIAILSDIPVYNSENEKITYTISEKDVPIRYVVPANQTATLTADATVDVTFENIFKKFTVEVVKKDIENGTVDTVVVEKTNKPQKGKISVSKTGDVFTNVTMTSSSYTDEDGNLVENPTVYTPVFEETGLAGAVFEITAAEDIVTADGTIRAKKGDVVATLTTDDNGYAESDLLYLGKYEVKEIKAPYGYVQNAVSETVELTYAGQEIEVRDTVNQTFVNDYQEVEITLSKFMEYDELFGLGENDEYRFVRFGLFADEVITAADGSVIPENCMIAEVSLSEDMTAKFDAQLPFGRYYVKEIATDEHYMLNGEKYLVNFEYMGQEITTVSFDCGTFENHLKRGNANGYKVNEDDEPLANALFGLFAVGTETFAADTAIKTAISDETGYFEFTEIPYGEYVIREIAAPDGYILSDKQYPVTINEDGDTVEITAENEAITVEISKLDITNDEELVGATLQIIDEDGVVVEEWVSYEHPHFIEAQLIAGKTYTLKETIAPDGYTIANSIDFTVNADGTVNTVVMYDEPIPDTPDTPTGDTTIWN